MSSRAPERVEALLDPSIDMWMSAMVVASRMTDWRAEEWEDETPALFTPSLFTEEFMVSLLIGDDVDGRVWCVTVSRAERLKEC